jgi:hypothetical protein
MISLSPDYFIHAANVLLVVAYSVRDILWLRLFAVGSSIISLPFFFLQPTVLWAPLSWTVGFAGLNLFQSWRLYLERRPIQLTAEEDEVRRLAFADVPPRKLLRLLSLASWSTAQSGERLIESGKAPDHLALIVRGKVRLTKAAADMGVLGPGDFIGSALILSGLKPDFDAVADEPVRVVRWPIQALEKYLDAKPEMRIVMQRHLARELSGKVRQLVDGP